MPGNIETDFTSVGIIQTYDTTKIRMKLSKYLIYNFFAGGHTFQKVYACWGDVRLPKPTFCVLRKCILAIKSLYTFWMRGEEFHSLSFTFSFESYIIHFFRWRFLTRICTVYITPSSDNMSQVVSLKYLRVPKYVHRYNSQVAELNGNLYVEYAFDQIITRMIFINTFSLFFIFY